MTRPTTRYFRPAWFQRLGIAYASVSPMPWSWLVGVEVWRGYTQVAYDGWMRPVGRRPYVQVTLRVPMVAFSLQVAGQAVPVKGAGAAERPS